jgi:hypothetical protein
MSMLVGELRTVVPMVAEIKALLPALQAILAGARP